MYAIPNYRLPKDLVRRFTACLEQMGVKFVTETVIGKDVAPEQLEKEFDSVYYATGAWKRPVLGLAGEELTVFGLDFLIEVNEWMQGKVGSEVLVTGGGNVAMDVAITAKRLGAKKVTMACLESENEMPASREEIARAKEEGIVIMPSWGLGKVIEEDGIVKGMELNRRGLIDVAEETQMTSREGVFAGGDATTGPATVIRGIATGHNAARGMNRYLGVTEPGCSGMEHGGERFLTFDPEGILNKKKARQEEIPADERSIEKEDSKSLPEAEALKEAGRCLNCGCYAVNPSDIAPVLVALDAKIVTTNRTIPAEEFCCSHLKVSEMLQPGELVTEIDIAPPEGAVMNYDKFRLRDSVDFAIVSLASVYSTENGKFTGARTVFGGAAPVPYRNQELEGWLIGKPVNEDTAEKAADLAVKNAIPFEKNKYKVIELKTLVKDSVLRMREK